MSETSDALANKEIAMAVNDYLKLKAIEDEHEDDISFWSADENTGTEQGAKDDVLETY